MQTPNNPLTGLRYKRIATSQRPPKKEDLNFLEWETSPWTLHRCSVDHPPLYPTIRTRSTGEKINPRQTKLRYSKPAVFPSLSHGIVCHSRGDINPRCVTCSTHGKAQHEQSAVLRRTSGESPPPGGVPWRSYRPGRQRDAIWSSKGRP